MSDTTTTNGIDVSHIEPWRIFQALFNNTHQQGLGVLDSSGSTPMSDEQAEAEFKGFEPRESYDGRVGVRFDYHRGRVMKVLILTGEKRVYTDDDFRLYDRDNFQGAGRLTVASVLADHPAGS